MSEPWLMRADSDPRTHALVIGVSKYQFLTEDGSRARAAERRSGSARPARRRPRPSASPSGSSRHTAIPPRRSEASASYSRLRLRAAERARRAPRRGARADWDNVALAVDDWMNDCATNPDNVAILYASGHGIQMSPDDGGIVLLEDFARLRNVLDHSLDVGAVRKGMAGPTMAQRQFYFVDACRVRPEEASSSDAGNGVGLPAMFEGRATVSPVFFAAIPSTEALGEVGDGTLFVQALLECLDTALGVDDHVVGGRLVGRDDDDADAAAQEARAATGRGPRRPADSDHRRPDGRCPVPRPTGQARGADPARPGISGGGRLRASTALGSARRGDLRRRGIRADDLAQCPRRPDALAVTIQPPTPPFADVPLFLVPALPPSYTGVVKVLA